jgi:hypothetical protein
MMNMAQQTGDPVHERFGTDKAVCRPGTCHRGEILAATKSDLQKNIALCRAELACQRLMRIKTKPWQHRFHQPLHGGPQPPAFATAIELR